MAKNIAEALRKEIFKCKLSDNELARATGVPQSSISRFLAGTDMRLASAAKIASYLKLELKKR